MLTVYGHNKANEWHIARNDEDYPGHPPPSSPCPTNLASCQLYIAPLKITNLRVESDDEVKKLQREISNYHRLPFCPPY